MKRHSLPRWPAALAVAALLCTGSASAAELNVMISAGFFRVYEELSADFEKTTGHKLVTTRGPSMGDSPEAIPTRLARGEFADVVIIDGGMVDELAEKGLVRPDSKVLLALSQVGMVARLGATKPDISSVDAFKRTLLAAKSVGYSDSGSGTYLSTVLFQKLGLADQVLGKGRKVRGPPSGEPVAAVVARGEVEIGFQQVSELIHTEGVTFVGPIPAELQPGSTFAAGITAGAREPEAALALIRFLTSPEAAATITKNGLATPPPQDPVMVTIQTELGAIVVEVDVKRAPITAANFLAYVDRKFYDGGVVNRSVRPDNTTRHDVEIQVIQFQSDMARNGELRPPIPLEPTNVTGIKHEDGVLSMARSGPDTATSSFFITIGDQPELDFGGKRNADGQGFGAFGRVVSGMDVVKKIQASNTAASGAYGTETLDPPIRIVSATRK